MSFFDLLFLCVAFVSAAAIPAIIITAWRGDRHRAFNIFRICGIAVILYLTVVFATSLALPIRILHIGDPQCSDDWCLTVTGIHPGSSSEYIVELRLSNRAKQAAQRKKGLAIYLVDEHGAQFSPIPDATEVPFDVLLQAGQSVTATRRFRLPADPGIVEMAVTRQGFQISSLIIGRSPFDGRTVVRLE